MEQRIDSSQLNASEMDALLELVRSQKKPALVDTEGNRTEIPEVLYRMLVHVLEQMKQGHSIIMMPEDEAFTTQAAANFLGISRQHLVNLLEDGNIPYHKVGSHRRVYFRDLKAYADRRDKNRREALDNLFDEVEKAGKYDSSYTGDERWLQDLEKWGVRAIHPQDYLLILYSMNPQAVIMKLNQIARKKQEELEDVILAFGKSLPAFSTRLLDDMGV